MLSKLIDLLTCGSLDASERDAAVTAIAAAPSDPQYDWTGSDDAARALALISALAEFIASGDKMDELHEQIQLMFEDGFPDYPHALEAEIRAKGVLIYYEWLDGELSQRALAEGGYDLVSLEGSGTDDIDVFVVYRRDTARIIDIATDLGLRLTRPLDSYRELQAMIDRRRD